MILNGKENTWRYLGLGGTGERVIYDLDRTPSLYLITSNLKGNGVGGKCWMFEIKTLSETCRGY